MFDHLAISEKAMVPDGAKTAQDSPKRTQDIPRWRKEWAKRVPAWSQSGEEKNIAHREFLICQFSKISHLFIFLNFFLKFSLWFICDTHCFAKILTRMSPILSPTS